MSSGWLLPTGLLGACAGAAAVLAWRRSARPEASLSPILENNALGMAHVRDRHYVWANTRWASILGLRPEHLTGTDVCHLHQDLATYEAFGREAYGILEQGGRYERDIRLRRVDGTPFWAHFCGSLLDPAHPEAGAVWSLEDVTGRVEAQEEQAEGLALNQKLIATSVTGILLLRAVDGRCILVNEAACRMLGEVRDRLLQSSFRRNPAWEATGLLETIEAVLAAPGDLRLEASLPSPGSAKVWMDVQFVPFVSRGQRLLLLMMLDVSERIRAGQDLQATEKAREALLEELKQKNKELETLVYVASHDLRSPLVNIQGFSQRLGKALDEFKRTLQDATSLAEVRAHLLPLLQERMPAALGYIRASGAKMDAIINGLLRLSRAGRMVLRAEPLDMDQLLQSAAASMAFQFQSAEADLQVAELPSCLADPVQVAQVFSNLLDNAIKYRDPGRPLRVRVEGRLEGRMAHYTVEDNGLGIPEAQQERIWDIFQRLDPTGPTPGEGLGLTLVRRMVERNGGRIWVASPPGSGCRFHVELPAG